MPLYAVGLNSKTHCVEEREKYALLDQQIVNRNEKLIEAGLVQEIVTLSTCNRVEHYFTSDRPVDEIIQKLFNGYPPNDLYLLKNNEVSHHLFQVASGLCSQVLGENEILGQVKKAYFLAQENRLTAKHLNVLFQKAICVGKRVRTVTGISKCSVSTGGIILDKIKHRFEDLSQITVLLIGAGDISRSVASSLYHKGVRNIFISNRTQDKGEMIAKELEATYVPINELYQNLKTADVVISSTTAPHYIIAKAHESYFTHGKKVMFDLAVPRDIETVVGEYDNIELFNIDSISTLTDLNKSKRENEILKANSVIALENCNFCLSHQIREENCIVNPSFFDFKKLYKWHKAHI